MRRSPLNVRGFALLAVIVCHTGLAVPAEGQVRWPGVPSLRRGRKPFNIEVVDLFGAKGMVSLRVFPGEQKDLDELGGDTRPAKICVTEGAAGSCYIARARETNFAQGAQASTVNVGDGRVAILFQVDYQRINDEWRLVTVLGVDSHGKLVNLLPVLVISMQDNFSVWGDKQASGGELITAAQYLWSSLEETHFSPHRYRMSTYRFCPNRGRYLLADRFITRKKFNGLDAENHPGDRVLRAMMPQVTKRLGERHDAGKQICGE